MDKLLEMLQYDYDPNWLPDNYISITERPSEVIKKLKIDNKQIQLRNQNDETQPLKFTKTLENTNTSLEASSTEHNADTLVHSQPMHSNLNERNHRN